MTLRAVYLSALMLGVLFVGGGPFVGTAAADAPSCGSVTYDGAGNTAAAGGAWEVGNVDQLQCIGENHGDASGLTDALGSDYELTSDIDASGTSSWNAGDGFDPIGDSGDKFTGTFDGNGHTISGLTIDRTAEQDIALFGYVDTTGTVENTTMDNPDIVGNKQVGSIAGTNAGTVTESATTAGTIESQSGYASASVGGIVGTNDGTVKRSYSTSDVIGDKTEVGGVVGKNTGTLSESYATGSVTTSGDTAGGLVGENTGSVDSSYWDTSTTGQGTSPGSPDDHGLTTSEMQDSAADDNMTAFDFTNTWQTVRDDYPDFAWKDLQAPKQPSSSGSDDESVCADVRYESGDGSAGNPYGIDTLPELMCLGHPDTSTGSDDHYELTADIDASTVSDDADVDSGDADEFTRGNFDPVGTSGGAFEGTFDGNGHTVSNLDIDGSSDTGLFESIAPGGTVRNLTLASADIDGGSEVGILAGTNDGTVTGVSVDGSVSASGDNVGGIVGSNAGTVDDSSSDANVSGTSAVGGLAGSNAGTVNASSASGNVSGDRDVGGLAGSNSGTVERSSAHGTVDGSNAVGGLVGDNSGTVTSSYATGDVGTSDTERAGGLVGYNVEGTVERTYATGNVSGSTTVGGLIGYNSDATVTDSYAVGVVDGSENVGGLVARNIGGTVTDGYWNTETMGVKGSAGGKGLLTTQMQGDAATATVNMSGLDFAGTWRTRASGYPLLAWQSKLSVSAVDTSVSDETLLEIEVSATRDREALLTLTNATGDTVATRPVTLTGDVVETVSFDPQNTAGLNADDGPYVATVTLNRSGLTASTDDITVVESTSGSVSLNQSVYSEQRGDVVAIGLSLRNTDTATVTIGTTGDNNWAQNVTVTDGNGDDFVTLEFNTYTAGTSDDTTPGGTGYPVYSVAADGDSVISVAGATGSFDPDTPRESTLSAADYSLSAVAGVTPAERTADGEDAAATLSLGESSTDSLDTYVAPGSRESDIGSVSDVDRLVDSGNITRASEIADEDLVVTKIDASGLEGILANRTGTVARNTTQAFFLADRYRHAGPGGRTTRTNHSWAFTVTEENPGPNEAASRLALNYSNTDVYADANDDEYWVIVDTAVTSDLSDGDELETNFTTDAVPDTDTSETSVADVWNFALPSATVDTNADIDGDGSADELTVQQASGREITGTTNVAPGTQLTVRVTGTDTGRPFVKPLTATAESDGNWTATADFRGNAPGTNFTVNVRRGGTQLVEDAVDGRIAAGQTASVTFDDQDSFGDMVTVESVRMSDGGFIVIHRNNATGEVIGKSAYFERGLSVNVVIRLNETLSEDTTLVAMPHQDTDGDRIYEFQSGSSVDTPYKKGGSKVTDSALITVTGPVTRTTATPTATPTTDMGTETDIGTETEADGGEETTPGGRENTSGDGDSDASITTTSGPGLGIGAALAALAVVVLARRP